MPRLIQDRAQLGTATSRLGCTLTDAVPGCSMLSENTAASGGVVGQVADVVGAKAAPVPVAGHTTGAWRSLQNPYVYET